MESMNVSIAGSKPYPRLPDPSSIAEVAEVAEIAQDPPQSCDLQSTNGLATINEWANGKQQATNGKQQATNGNQRTTNRQTTTS